MTRSRTCTWLEGTAKPHTILCGAVAKLLQAVLLLFVQAGGLHLVGATVTLIACTIFANEANYVSGVTQPLSTEPHRKWPLVGSGAADFLCGICRELEPTFMVAQSRFLIATSPAIKLVFR